jgi:hypothetical protein
MSHTYKYMYKHMYIYIFINIYICVYVCFGGDTFEGISAGCSEAWIVDIEID